MSNLFKVLDGISEEITPKENPKSQIIKEKKVQIKPTPKWMNRKLISKNIKSHISVVTYNILCSQYADPKNFSHVKLQDLSWEYRREKILDELKMYKADFICLQEMDHFRWFEKKLLPFNYLGVYKNRNSYRPDGCAIFYKKDYELMDSLFVKFNDVYHFDYVKKEFQTDNVGMICLFEKNGQKLLVANTHIFWNPSYPHIKLIQCFYLLEKISEYLNERKLDIPVIICGDFNSLPDSHAYEFMKNGITKYEKLYFSHSLELSSSFEKEPKFTNFTPDFKGTLDYIFYNSQLKVSKILEITTEDQIKTIGLPNSEYPSDHLSLYCEFNLFLNK